MATPQERVSAAIRFFFEKALPQATGKSFAQLTDPRVHVGGYAPYSGPAVATSFGQSLTPRFMLRVSPPVPVTGGVPAPGNTTAQAAGPGQHLVWLRHVADPVADDEAEIRRVMADVDSFAALFAAPAIAAADGGAGPGGAGAAGPGAPAGTGAAGTTAGAPAGDAGTGAATSATPVTIDASLRATEWARGIKAAAALLPADLNALTEVPAPLRTLAADADGLKQVLLHFFTYRATGARYSRWAGAGRDASNPAHLTADYKQENVREVPLERERVYLYAVVPESLLAGSGDLDWTAFREVIIRFDDTSEDDPPYTLAAVHTTRWRRNAAPHEDFVFFYTEVGDGIQFPRESQAKMSARLIEFLGVVESAGEHRTEILRAATHVLTESADAQLRLLALMDPPETPLPPYALGDADGAVRSVQLALEKLGEFVALPAVRHVELVPSVQPNNDLARAAVRYPDLDTKIPAAKRGGAGVVVGIIDSGIDGSHPAFAGRIHAFWDQASAPNVTVTGKTPKGNHPGVDAYKDMDFGVEVTATTTPSVAAAKDPAGHGTHVAGIAAGAEVKDGAGNVTVPAGVAPKATIVAVRAIGIDEEDFIAATRYVFQKATELSMPCVVNMSFGQHFHAHDGSDFSARALFKAVTDANKHYLPGRVVIAAAGNERDNQMHVRRSLPAKSGYRRLADIKIGRPLGYEVVNIWIRNPLSACPVSFPLDLYVFRVTTPLNTNVSRAVRLGSSTTAANPAGVFNALRIRVEIESSLTDDVNGDFNFQLVFRTTQPGAAATSTTPAVPALAMIPTQWGIAMINGSSHPLDVHMWIPIERRDPGSVTSVFADFAPADVAFMVGSPASSAAAISVAASNTRLSWKTPSGDVGPIAGTLGDITFFSSPGPLRDSSIPPARFYGVTHEINGVDVTAPGAMLQSARSAQSTPQANLIVNAQSIMDAGTSMASPVVTGLVANILADNPTMTMTDVLAKLKSASSIPATSAFQPPAGTAGTKPLSKDWGYGLVNAGLLK